MWSIPQAQGLKGAGVAVAMPRIYVSRAIVSSGQLNYFGQGCPLDVGGPATQRHPGQTGTLPRPVDSEHSAQFQSMRKLAVITRETKGTCLAVVWVQGVPVTYSRGSVALVRTHLAEIGLGLGASAAVRGVRVDGGRRGKLSLVGHQPARRDAQGAS